MTSAPVATEHALELEDVEVEYRVRGAWKRVLRGVSLHIAEGESYGLVGESGCGKSTAAFAALRYLPRNGRVSNGGIRVAGEDLLAMSDADVRKLRDEQGVDGLPEPHLRAEPHHPHRRPGGRGVHPAGGGGRRGRRPGAGDAREGADLRPRGRHAPLPAPALGRDEPARGDRHGAGQGSHPADPRRAHHGARRHRRERGARPRGRPARGVRLERAVHQPQPRGDPAHVRSSGGPLRRARGRAGAGAGGLRQPPPPLHGRAAALHPARGSP